MELPTLLGSILDSVAYVRECYIKRRLQGLNGLQRVLGVGDSTGSALC